MSEDARSLEPGPVRDSPAARLRRLAPDAGPAEGSAALAAIEAEVRAANPASVLAAAAAWRDRASAAGAPRASLEAAALVRSLLAREAERWNRRAEAVVAGGDPDACARALRRATEIETDALTSSREPPERGPCERAAVRAAFAAAARAGAGGGTEARDRWAGDLLDRSASALTDVDEMAPEAAAAALGLVRDDVAWHVENVESAPGPRRRRLLRRRRRLDAEIQERALQARLEARYGRAVTAFVERLVLALVFLVLGLLLVEATFALPPAVVLAFTVADTAACAVFLGEFFAKLALVPSVSGRGRSSWFLRHVWVDFLPSLPFGLLVLGYGHADPARAGRVARLLRLPQAARYVRVLLPAIRLLRAFGFLTRGLDRLARRYARLLDREVVLFPTEAERRSWRRAEEDGAGGGRAAEAELESRWRTLLLSAPPEAREEVAAARVEALREASRAAPRSAGPPAARREVPAEEFLATLASATEAEVEARLPPDLLRRVARAVRTLSRAPLRWMPVVRRFAPRPGPRMSDPAVVAAAARRAGRELARQHDRVLWFGDLYGTVTPAEFVDRLGTAMVKGSAGPAYRLTFFGGFFLLVQLLLVISGLEILARLAGVLGNVVGTFLIVLGGVCFGILALGWWLKRIANEATAFYEQVAAAQFLPLTETIKARFLEADARALDERVLTPERRVHRPEGSHETEEDLRAARRRFLANVRAWLQEAHASTGEGRAFDPVDRVVLLYRDALDGGLFADSDTRTTNQFLGSPALRHLRERSRRVDRRERRALRGLDLERQRSLLRGPTTWFNFLTRAIAHSVARLAVDYNRNAIPRAELPRASLDERRRHAAWLERRPGSQDAWAHAAADARDPRTATTAFTALHFLDDDPRRDREVRERFGLAVARRLAEDRRLLFRRVFGGYPFHERPREQRVLNVHRLYEGWFSGGRALLVPARLAIRALRFLAAGLRWTSRSIREIRRPTLRADVMTAATADEVTALRKILRVRGPILRACTWLRARVDLEYLGYLLPGTERSGLEGHDVDADAALLADPTLERDLALERRRAQRDLARIAALREGGLVERLAERLEVPRSEFGREHLRAAVAAYRGDFDGIRTLLSCEEILAETLDRAPGEEIAPRSWRPLWRTRARFRRWWKARGRGDRESRRAVWLAIRSDRGGARRALAAWAVLGPAQARERGERALAEVLRHPHRVSEQIVTLRAVQTLALLDLRNYRDHVRRLGRYEPAAEAVLTPAEEAAEAPGEPASP